MKKKPASSSATAAKKKPSTTITTTKNRRMTEQQELLLSMNDGIRDEKYFGDKRGFQLADAVVVMWGYRDPRNIKMTDDENDEGIEALKIGQRQQLAKSRILQEKDVSKFLTGEKSIVECRKSKFSSTMSSEAYAAMFSSGSNVIHSNSNNNREEQFSSPQEIASSCGIMNTKNTTGRSSDVITNRKKKTPQTTITIANPQEDDDCDINDENGSSSSSIMIADDSEELRIMEEQKQNAKRKIPCQNSSSDDDDDDDFYASIKRKFYAAQQQQHQNQAHQKKEEPSSKNDDSRRRQRNNEFEANDGESTANQTSWKMPDKFKIVVVTSSSSVPISHQTTIEQRVPIFKSDLEAGKAEELDRQDVSSSDEREHAFQKQEKDLLDRVSNYFPTNSKVIESASAKLNLRPVAFKRNLRHSVQTFHRAHKESLVLQDALSLAFSNHTQSDQ